MGSIPGLGRSPGVGNGNPLQHSCLENCVDREAWQATSPWGRKESDTTERLHFHFLFILRSGFILRNDHVKFCSLQRTRSVPNSFTCSVDCDTAAMEP